MMVSDHADNHDAENGKTVQLNVIEESDDFKVSGWGHRHQQCLILFFCLLTALSMRSCMGVALVDMVNNTTIPLADTVASLNNTHVGLLHNENRSALNDSLSGENKTRSYVEAGLHALLFIPPYPKFQWTKKIQDVVTSSFFWGYMLLQIPGGQLAHRFGARYLLTGALLINAVMCFSVPWAAYYGGWIFLAIVRMVQGLTQACLLPGVHTILAKWAPLEERGRLAGWAYGGSVLGAVLGLTITGFIAASPLGWPGIFRFYGIVSAVVGSVMWIFGADTPAQHKRISAAEKRYIEERIGVSKGKKRSIPWSKIIQSRGVWAIVAAHVGSAWGQLTFYTEVPAFMDKVMGVNIKANGVLTALPYLLMWFANFFYTWFSDMLIVKKILNVARTRKLANSFGSFLPAVGLVVLAYVPKNIYVVEAVLIVLCVCKVASNVGFHINHIDISTNFSGTLIGISNFAANAFGSLAPIVAGFILTDVTSEYLWRQVFFVSAAMYTVTNLVYVALGEGEKADWDNLPDDENETKDDDKEIEPMIKENQTTLQQ
ncbi:putative inorganic phosphate cotransporter [Bicyclus anynana]|uniref:Inorganic phosphate cotransporter n=1 Tax=Bicyclus anynana TaxID=110368 RepID=A0ABM3LR58_BICAN|nr:putative inorganic phosphate cotransporter [Bicyclus anynana]